MHTCTRMHTQIYIARHKLTYRQTNIHSFTNIGLHKLFAQVGYELVAYIISRSMMTRSVLRLWHVASHCLQPYRPTGATDPAEGLKVLQDSMDLHTDKMIQDRG